MIKQLKWVAFGLAAISITSCDKNPYPGFETSPSGIVYKIIKKSTSNKKPQPGDLLTFDIKGEGEKLPMFNTYKEGQARQMFPMSDQVGSMDDVIKLMSPGDSAVMWFKAEDFFQKSLGKPLPEKIKPEAKLCINFSLREIMPASEFQAKQTQMMEQMKKMKEDASVKEKNDIAEYIKKNNIKATPDANGMYIVVTQKGSGPKPERGDMVKVHYVGKYINGDVFQASKEVNNNQPFEFPIGVGQVMPGWELAIPTLNSGTKATLIIPYMLAYGEQGNGEVIPPFSTLVFDIELVEVVKSK